MLLDTEAEVAARAEVAAGELVLLDLEALLEDLSSLGTTDGGVDGDLLVSADAEGSHSVSGCKKIVKNIRKNRIVSVVLCLPLEKTGS